MRRSIVLAGVVAALVFCLSSTAPANASCPTIPPDCCIIKWFNGCQYCQQLCE